MPQPSVIPVEARSYELDAYGHLNQGVSVQWFEHGRLCYLRDRGMTYESIPEQHGVHIMVLRQDITYRAQVRLGDRFDLVSRVARLGRSSLTWEHELRPESGGEPVTTATVTMVCVGADEESAPIPEGLRTALSSEPGA